MFVFILDAAKPVFGFAIMKLFLLLTIGFFFELIFLHIWNDNISIIKS